MAVLSVQKTLFGLASLFRLWRRIGQIHPVLLLISVSLFAPIIAIVFTAFGDTQDLMPHLLHTVLGRYLANTIALMAGVGALSLIFGVSSAWMVARYDFPGRRMLEWMLVLPAAMPAYIIAYSYTDFLEFAGPFQTFLRDLFGWKNARDYWIPEIRSFGGAVLVMASVLYPYIYLLARTAFRQTSTALFEVAALSGRTIFWQVAMPLGRPAIMAGLSLVMMEVVSDFGTVDYFALETLTLGIFNVWLGMNNIAAAAQIALWAFILIGMLLMMEIFARSRRSFQNSSAGRVGVPIKRLSGFSSIIAMLVCGLPVLIGFIFPVSILIGLVIAQGHHAEIVFLPQLIQHSVMLAVVVAMLVIFIALICAILAYYRSGTMGQMVATIAASGYAFPGTILAIGVLGVVGFADKIIVFVFDAPLLIGSLAVLIFGLMVRFHAVGFGALSSGIRRMPPHMMESGRILGYTQNQTTRHVILPLLRSSIIAGGLLVFVDVMKELPITLLLRPFSFETFATFTYQYAKDEMLEVAALPALLIVCVGLLPVFFANRALEQK